MKKINEPDYVKYFLAILSNPDIYKDDIERAKQYLEKEFGEIDYISKWFPFDMTDYYEEEMGRNLSRSFLSFKKLYSPEELAEFKTITNAIETNNYKNTNARKVNLDCGYIDYNKVVLASVKYAGQKIYLSKGIYADMVLYYRKGIFEPFFWTFPDFKDKRYNNVLCDIRNLYKKERKIFS